MEQNITVVRLGQAVALVDRREKELSCFEPGRATDERVAFIPEDAGV